MSKGYLLSTNTAGTTLFTPKGNLYLWSCLIATIGPLHYVHVLLQCIDERVQFLSKKEDEYSLWHQHMGHPSCNAIKHLHTATKDLISSPWSTDRKKNPLLSFPRRELVKGACFCQVWVFSRSKSRRIPDQGGEDGRADVGLDRE